MNNFQIGLTPEEIVACNLDLLLSLKHTINNNPAYIKEKIDNSIDIIIRRFKSLSINK